MISGIGLQAVKGERDSLSKFGSILIQVNCSRSLKQKYLEESDQRVATIEVLACHSIQELGTKIGQWDSVSRIQNGGGERVKMNIGCCPNVSPLCVHSTTRPRYAEWE
jgi:hypothetical protein